MTEVQVEWQSAAQMAEYAEALVDWLTSPPKAVEYLADLAGVEMKVSGSACSRYTLSWQGVSAEEAGENTDALVDLLNEGGGPEYLRGAAFERIR